MVYAQFPNLKFTSPREKFDSLSLALSDYYNYQFLGNTGFVFDQGPVVTLDKDFAYYGQNSPGRRDALLCRMAEEACNLADGKVDFSLYDNDNDGNVSALLIIVPGMPESAGAGEEYFWPQYATFADQGISLTLDRKHITAFAMCTELGKDGRLDGIGQMAHEFGHTLGLMDMYDTDLTGSGGLGRGLWRSTSLMDFGNENDSGATPPNLNAIEREILGAGNCGLLEEPGEYSLEPIDRNGRYFKLAGSGADDYFLFECRKEEGYDAHIGGGGMLIYHVDKREQPAGWSSFFKRIITAAKRWEANQVNCNPEHECAALMAAIPDSPDVRSAFWPQEDLRIFSPETCPSFSFWNGEAPRFALTGMEAGADGVSFSLIEPIHMQETAVFQRSAILNWTVDPAVTDADSCKVEWYGIPEEIRSMRATGSGDGRYSFTMDNLTPGTGYHYKVTIYCGKTPCYSSWGDFTTQNMRSGLFRFIFLQGAERNADGSFVRGGRIPLVVYNSGDGDHAEWFFDGAPIHTGSDGLWEITHSGTLKVKITDASGAGETIIKEITVR